MMKSCIYRIILTIIFLLLFVLMLMYPAQSVYYAFSGLTLWFQKMIPSLFPFMILSGIMVRMNLTGYFGIVLSPVLKPLFKVSKEGVYCIIMGFLCGFPMGARVISDLYKNAKITKSEASYLLSFCNNIGPIYFTGFVLPALELEAKFIYIFGMYGLPLIYGMILSGLSRKKDITEYDNTATVKKEDINKDKSFLIHMDGAIGSAIESITKLGGYMILFNLFNLIPAMILPQKSLAFCNIILEITAGISRIGKSSPLMILIMLPFGGFSCIAQTYSIINKTDLSIGRYFMHKCILTLITACYYGVCFFFSKHGGTYL